MTFSTRDFRLIAIFVGINVVLVGVGWIALVAPQRHDAAAASAKAQAAEAQLNTIIRGQSDSHGGPVKQPVIKTADLYALDTALPAQADQPSLLLELDRIAKASHVQVAGISPLEAQSNAGGYTVVPINLSLSGSFFALTDFLHTLRTLVSERDGHLIANGPLFTVTAASFTPGVAKGDAPATVAMDAFYYGVTAGAAPPASTTDTTTTTGG